ncbi:acetolactate synthase catalytic subunit [Streptomyces samsunensis]|uniref:acetolactate synthase catalytic subunit n=1 Tax=Streptomyces malaysiensis TaxID=92644 RepID=UPI0015835CF0|nr:MULTISPECIES: acetolactate synthase catalytic subunit [Streptomyces]MCM3806768.1 acetolactate synthase catalytic subunit [Streptomyces sp. DR7-3]NUH37094.1 acetolactate synthase catalytic subunit [Streptomyces samsunensis]
MTSTVARGLAAALRRHGVSDVFGQSLPSLFFLATPEESIRQIVYRTENAGGAMADGYARVSGKVGVVAAQNGPAATLLVPPLAEAFKASVPVIAIVQEVPQAARDRNAFQELDHIKLFAACAKAIHRIDDPARVDDYVDAAVTEATSGRPGPVVLLVPKDVLAAPLPVASSRRAGYGHFPLDRYLPGAEQIKHVADLLASAERPLVVAGGGVHVSGAAPELHDMQQLAALPVATTPMGKGTVDETDPLSVGVIGYAMGDYAATHYARPLVADADVIVFVGTRTNENATDAWRLFPPTATYVHIDMDPVEVGRNYEAVRLVGDAKLTLRAIVDQLKSSPLDTREAARDQVIAQIAQARIKHEQRIGPRATADGSPIRPERIMKELDALLTPDTIVVADASYSSIWMSNYLRAQRGGQRFLSPRGLAGLGWGLPMAIGAKAAGPNSPVVAVVGDGGFAHCWSELETAVRMNLPLTVIVLNNAILGYQKHSELHQFAEHTTAIDITRIDHAAIATACGARGVRVDVADDLAGALRDAMGSSAVTVIDVVTAADAFPPISAWDDDPTLSELTAGVAL